MTRLPSVDRTTQQSEMAVFASLGLAAVLMISLALIQMTKFVACSDRIAAALTLQPAGFAGVSPEADGKIVFTNTVWPAGERANAPAGSPDQVLPPA